MTTEPGGWLPALVLDPREWRVEFGDRLVDAQQILRFGHACLVREGDQWLLGLITGDDRVTCFEQYDTFQEGVWAL